MPDRVNETSFEYIKKIVLQRYGCEGLVFREDGDSAFPVMIMRGSDKTIAMPPFLGGIDLQSALRRQDAGLRMTPSDDFVKNITGESSIPVFTTGNGHIPEKLICFEENEIKIAFDLLGTVFFILTRMEEIKSPVRDGHGRFPASASHALQNGYLHRPVADELVEVLWQCIKFLWPSAGRKETRFQTVPSHDVDIPFSEAFFPPSKIFYSLAGDIVKRKAPGRALKRFFNWPAVKMGNFRRDANYTFDRIMDMSEEHGLRSAFYFKAGCSNSKYDNPYPIDHPYFHELFRDIHAREHEIGLHPSYETFRDPGRTRKEFAKLLAECEKENIRQRSWGGRQHYLRWEAPSTWHSWSEAGLSYDSSLGYADCSGFRCGTCHEFLVFDALRNQPLNLAERPLVVMESTLFADEYMNLSSEKAIEKALFLKRQCRKYGGNFTILWHNSSFETGKMWGCYRAVLEN